MVIVLQKIQIPKDNIVHIYGLGDIHYGSANLNKKALARTIQKIKKQDNCYWVGMGDLIEAIPPHDDRWCPNSLDPDMPKEGMVDWQINEIVKTLQPIAMKCVGLIAGNHERKYERMGKYSSLVHHRICEKLGVRNLKNSAYVVLKSACGSINIYAHHGWSTSQTDAGKVAMLQKLLTIHEVDIVMVGHSHTQNVKHTYTLRPNPQGTGFDPRKSVGVVTGSFMETYKVGTTNYSEDRGFPFSGVGVPKVLYNLKTKEISVELS